MTAFSGPTLLAPAGSTGNNTHAAKGASPGDSSKHAFQFVIEAVGGTPTVTFKVQGSFDGTNWFDVAYVTDASDTLAVTALTKTGVGAYLVFVANPAARFYSQFRLVTSANTNVTYRCELYELVGD